MPHILTERSTMTKKSEKFLSTASFYFLSKKDDKF